ADDSQVDFFPSQPGASYPPGRSAAAALARRNAWDPTEEGDLPTDLANLLIDTLKDVYGPGAASGTTGQWAAHPRIVDDYDAPGDPPSHGFPSVEGLKENYRTLRRHVKQQTTDF